MKQTLILDSLEIHQFRAFRHLQIERLGRVNLIVGKNNVGKSCLLEALWLYARRGTPTAIWDILEARDEGKCPQFGIPMDINDFILTIKHLFYGREDILERVDSIKIGPIDSRDSVLSIATSLEEYDKPIGELIPGLTVQMGTQPSVMYRLDYNLLARIRGEPKPAHCIFMPASGSSSTSLISRWDSIALTDLENDVLDSLRIIAPEVERITLVSSPEQSGKRIPVVKTTGLDSPIPLRSLGEGMSRIFGIALALVSAKDGMLLIDEVDSGLHYSIQPDMWRLIFQVARRLNVQVFATTHSWDCIEAFQEAAQEHGQGEGMLVSLRRKRDEEEQVVAILFDEKELEIVTREQIEVR
jgi:predicted ATPase